MIIRLRARAHLNAEKTSFQSQRAFNVKELPTSKSYRRQIASNAKELPMSKSFRRQKASDAKELCNNKFRRWLGGGGGMWSCFVSPLHYQQGVAQQPNAATRQTPPRAKRPRGHRLSSVAQRWCLDRPTVAIFPNLKNALFQDALRCRGREACIWISDDRDHPRKSVSESKL